MRYYVHGGVSLDADDHKKVGDLPDDFPARQRWVQFLVDLRDARNKGDYDPWPDTHRTLPLSTHDAVALAGEFVREVRAYLKSRGCL